MTRCQAALDLKLVAVSSSRSSRTRILDAALSLLTERGGAEVTMAEIGAAAGVSRQAVYLHFPDRAALLVALVRYADQQRGMPAEVRKVTEAPSGTRAVAELVGLQARMNHTVWPLARALDGLRRTDEDAERSWRDRLQNRLEGCRHIVGRLAREGHLRPGLDLSIAADLLWTMTSLRTWEDLVLIRGWEAEQYQAVLTETLLRTLTVRNVPNARL